MKISRARGFTLIEVGLVLIAIGILAGVVLKGQELINIGKARNIAVQQYSARLAWYLFQTRYGKLPGDWNKASFYVPGAVRNGDGSGEIEANESVLVFHHLTAAGFINCAACENVPASGIIPSPGPRNTLVNAFGGVMAAYHGDSNYAAHGRVGGMHPNRAPKLLFYTGARIPAPLLMEADRKVDDDYANTGNLLFSTYDPFAVLAPKVRDCIAYEQTNITPPSMLNDMRRTIWKSPARTGGTINPINCGAAIVL